MRRILAFAIAIGMGILTSGTARAGALSAASQYNVFALGNFSDSTGDVQGAPAAAGVVNLGNNFKPWANRPRRAFSTWWAGPT